MLKSKPILKKIRFLFLVISIMFLATACSSEKRVDENMVLRLVASKSLIEDGGVDIPWSNISFTNALIFRNLFISDAETEEVFPDLAQSYTTSEDGLTYEIILKENQVWSDGEIITPEDVIFSIEASLSFVGINPIFTSAFNSIVGAKEFIKGESDNISGLNADENKLIINLTKPVGTFARVLAQFAILPEHILHDADPNLLHENEYWIDPIISGMYKVGEHIKGESLEYVYNEKYTGEQPYIGSIMLRADYSYKEIDLFDTNDISMIQDFRALVDKREYEIDSLTYRYFVFNMQKDGEIDPIMSDKLVRNAITYAIDFPQIVKYIYFNTVSMSIPSFQRNTDKAIELLAEAEYDFDRPLVILSTFKDETSVKFMEYVKHDLEEVGFTVDVIFGNTLHDEKYSDYDVAFKGLSVFDISEWYAEYESTHEMQINCFGGEPMFDELLDSFRAEQDLVKKEEILNEMKILANTLMYKLPIFTMGHMTYIEKDRLEITEDTVFSNPRYKYFMDFRNWKIKY